MQERILDKIRKLLRLSESDNVAEAANAAAAAQRLIDEHRITAALIGDVWDDEAPIVMEPIDKGTLEKGVLGEHKSRSAWRWQLAWVVCDSTGCSPWRTWTHKAVTTWAYGRELNIAHASYLYTWLEKEIERLANMLASGKGRSYKTAFRYGALDEIKKRLRSDRKDTEQKALAAAEQRATAGDSQALVRVQTALAEVTEDQTEAKDWMRGMGLKYSSGRTHSVSSDGGYSAGQRAGRGISLGTRKALKG